MGEREGQTPEEMQGSRRHTCRDYVLASMLLAPLVAYAVVGLVFIPMRESDNPYDRARAVTVLSGAQFGLLGLCVLLVAGVILVRTIPRIVANPGAWHLWRDALMYLLMGAAMALGSYDGLARMRAPGTLPTLEQIAPGPVGLWDHTLFNLVFGAAILVMVVRQMRLPDLWKALGVPAALRTRGGRLALGGCALTSLAIAVLVVLMALLPDRTNGGLGLALVGAMLVGLAVAACVSPLVALHDAADARRGQAHAEGGDGGA